MAWRSRFAICRASRGHYLLDCFALLAMTRVGWARMTRGKTGLLRVARNDKGGLRSQWQGRGLCRAWQGCVVKVDCFALLAMNPSMWKQAKAQFEQIRGYAQGTQYPSDTLWNTKVNKGLLRYTRNDKGGVVAHDKSGVAGALGVTCIAR